MPEWLIGAVSKTVVPPCGTVGSNPTPSASTDERQPFGKFVWQSLFGRFAGSRRTFRRGARVDDWARLESVCTLWVPWVRIPPPPP